MEKPLLTIIVVTLLLLFISLAAAGSTDNHQVTVMVNPINELTISGGTYLGATLLSTNSGRLNFRYF